MVVQPPAADSMLDFSAIFDERKACFQELLELARQQLALIEGDQYTALLSMLGQKQRIIGRLEAVQRAVPDLWPSWRQLRERLDARQRARCEECLAESEAILAQLMRFEHQGTDYLTHRRDQTRLQLQSLTTSTQAHDAYRDSLAPVTHRHLNLDY